MTLLSADRSYRYTLARRTGFGDTTCLFVMLNPSTADEFVDDATIRRCMGFARAWGYGWLHVANLFAFRATDPQTMKAAYPEPSEVAVRNIETIMSGAHEASRVVAAWGNHGAFMDRGATVLAALAGIGPVWCLGMTKAGQPKHPLYVPRATEPIRMDWAA